MTDALWELTAKEMRDLIRKKEISRVELVQAHLNRIEQTNSQVNALIDICADEALEQARQADAHHDERADLPLDGIPFSIKDHYDVKGMKHTEGLPARADDRSPDDEPVVKRLREAGAIIVGKANQPDLQIRWNTISHLFGATRNPRDLTKTAGGSSGGDAAAVTAGMAAIAMGQDYGGSIRVPASFCGIYGLRPSAGRVPSAPTIAPMDGPPSLDLMASKGPLARCIEDLQITYEVITGQHHADPATVPVPMARNADNGKRPRVALMVDQTGAKVTDEIRKRLNDTAKLLQDAGYEIEEAAIPHAKRAPEVWAEIIGTELMEIGMPEFGHLLGASNRQHIEEMFGIYNLGGEAKSYIGALVERRKIQREVAGFMEGYQLVLCPVAGMATPSLEFDHMLNREDTIDLFDHMRNITWVNLLSLPSLALSNGIQIVGRRFREDQILEAGLRVQQTLGVASVATP